MLRAKGDGGTYFLEKQEAARRGYSAGLNEKRNGLLDFD